MLLRYALPLLLLTPAFVHAQVQHALDFDGVDDGVTVANASALIANSDAFSLTCWVYPTNAAANFPDMEGFVGFRDNAGCDLYLLQTYGTSLEGRFRSSANVVYTVDSVAALTIDTWQFLALTYDGDSLRMYRDGLLLEAVGATGTITATNKTFHVGNIPYQTGTDFRLDGKVDESTLWKRGLSEAEIMCVMQYGALPSDPDLVLYYKSDQGVAGGANAGITTLIDASGHLDGVLQGLALSGASSNFVQGAPIAGALSAAICQGETYDFNGQSLTEAGTYTESFPTGGGCDSTVVLELTVGEEVDTAVVQSGSTLISTAVGASWQWMDCSDPDDITPISNATGQYYQATEVGSYAVMVTQNGCSAMSACYTVTTIGIQELEQIRFTLSPVPVKEVLYVDLTTPVRLADVTVLDMTGRELMRLATGTGRRLSVDVSGLGQGAYFLRITAAGATSAARFVRE